MKAFIIVLSLVLSFGVNAEIFADFVRDPVEQVFSGTQPNDVATDSIRPNVGVITTADRPGIYSVVGFDLVCEGDTFKQIWGKGEDSPSDSFALKAPNTRVNTFANWDAGKKACNLLWKAETAGTKTTTGASIDLTFDLGGFQITISGSSTEEPPNNRKQESGSKLFEMIKDPAPSGSTGSSC